MRTRSTNPTPRRCRRNGLTLVECVVCTLLVALGVVAALRTAGASAAAVQRTGDRATARALAGSLMNEILAQNYKDPGPLPLFGLEVSELLATRASLDDVDDYHGLIDSPPADATGATIPGVPAGWNRAVSVAWVVPTNPAQTSAVETGVKRVTVDVRRGNTTFYSAVGIKGDAP